MSYSFTVAGDTKSDAKQKIADAFADVVVAQPSHAADRDAAVAAGSALVDVLADPADGQEICVSICGSLSWDYANPESFTAANASVSAAVRAKQS